MKKIILFMTSLLFILSVNGFADSVNDLTIYTEEFPPYNYTEKGEIKGIASDIIKYVLDEIGFPNKEIASIPWARSYKTTQKKKNTALFSMTYTDSRKPIFKWAGPLAPTRTVIFAKKSKNIKINSKEDLKKYQIGVISEDIGEVLLNDLGVKGLQIQKSSSAESNIKKLMIDRIDLWAYGELTGKWFIKKYANPSEYEPVFTLQEGQTYIAFNKKTDDEIIEKFQKALDKLFTVDKDKHQKILDTYLK